MNTINVKYLNIILLFLIACEPHDPQNYISDEDLIIKLKETIKYIEYNSETQNPTLCIDNYDAVLIENLYWMTNNWDSDTFANGKIIPEEQDMHAWHGLKTPAWCYYNNDIELGKIYGKLYNWDAVSDTNCLCPKNWRVASLDDWLKITNYYGGVYAAPYFLNSKNIWGEGRNGNNKSGLNILPGGYRPTFEIAGDSKSDFEGLFGAVYWSSTMEPLLFGKFQRRLAWGVDINDNNVFVAQNLFFAGQSVRCVKDIQNEENFKR